MLKTHKVNAILCIFIVMHPQSLLLQAHHKMTNWLAHYPQVSTCPPLHSTSCGWTKCRTSWECLSLKQIQVCKPPPPFVPMTNFIFIFIHLSHIFIVEVLIARLAGLNPSAMVLARAQNLLIEEQQKQLRLSQTEKSNQTIVLKRQKDEEVRYFSF